MSRKWINVLVAGVAVSIGVFSSLYIIDQTQYGIEIRLGDPVRVITEPGLYVKAPFITDIQKIDNRLIFHDIPPGTIITQDKKTMLVDNYAEWRVVDPLLFYQSAHKGLQGPRGHRGPGQGRRGAHQRGEDRRAK